MGLFGIQVENAFVYEIMMKCIFFYSNYNDPPGYLPNSRGGRNHLLVISSAFGLLAAQTGVFDLHQ
jgi:hypothetical protein